MKNLISIQSELNAKKSKFNKFGGYNYRSCEDIIESLKPLLKKYECILNLTDELEQRGDRYYIKATATITDKDGHSFSSVGWAREAESKKGMDESQITGCASSYARKYALCGLFAIDDGVDADFLNGQSDMFAMAKQEINAATDKETLMDIYTKYLPVLGDDAKFKSLLSERKKQLK